MSAPQKNTNASKPEKEKLSGEDSRLLQARVLKNDFGVWKWAWENSEPKSNQSDFTREAMRAATSKLAAEMIAKGKKVPQFVAEYLAKEK